MQREHDERAKLIAEQALDTLGDVRRELEIPATDALRIDLWFQRHPPPQRVPTYLALLDRLCATDCMLEAFSQAVSLPSFWQSIRKQFAWREQLQRVDDKALVPPPRLWVISA